MTQKDKQTEEKIFESASEIFIKKGMDGTRMQDIADHAGINKSLLHYYFRSKERLFNAVFDKIAGDIFGMFSPLLENKLSLEEKIRYFIREHITFLQKNPGLPSFILNEVNRNPEMVQKILGRYNLRKVWSVLEEQHKDELAGYNITKDNVTQFMTSLVSMSVFPFAAKNIISVMLEKMGYGFEEYIGERKEFAAEFVINAIKGKEHSKG